MLKFDWNILWTVINLLLFFVLMKVFLFKPIKKTLDARQEKIDSELKHAADTEAQADAKLADYEEKIANADQEVKEIISKGKDDARVEYNKIIDKASVDVQKMKSDAQKQIDQESENARRSIKEEIAQLAMATAEKVVSDSANAKIDSDIYNKFLNEGSENND